MPESMSPSASAAPISSEMPRLPPAAIMKASFPSRKRATAARFSVEHITARGSVTRIGMKLEVFKTSFEKGLAVGFGKLNRGIADVIALYLHASCLPEMTVEADLMENARLSSRTGTTVSIPREKAVTMVLEHAAYR